ncbi:peptidylprolyl isomerase [Wolbachia pipientis]|uniref:Parvulin-like PPIase n=1 Tax=Wolbachia pipientis TaxID=955 RepID=A0A1E7QJ97_WOLPI|nr:SurA N-terminal domain-containing protein [Wolbachia pipientis]OEY86540.1 peptidylprolyl isomerase [Wolbachia pipientis]
MNIKNFCMKIGTLLLAFLLIFVYVSNLIMDYDNKQKIVATVGNEVILLDEYKRLYQNYSSQISSDEEQKILKYDLLDMMIKHKLLFNLIHDLGLEIGEESVTKHIQNTKYFQNDKGEFDKKIFYTTLDRLHITEDEYISQLKKKLPLLMFNTVIFKENYPVTFGTQIDKQIYNHRYQTRVVDIIKITKDAVTDIPEPEEKDLLDLYEENKPSFQYPEYRTAQYIIVDSKYFEDLVNISDEEVEKIINKQALKDQRNILNLIFSTKEEAEHTRKAIEAGETSFEQISKLEDIRINNITKDFLPTDSREKVFSLKEGDISQIFNSSFGWHLIKVESIHQISDNDLFDLKEKIRSALINQKSFEKKNDFINQVNYKIHNGSTIEDISNEYNLQLHTIGPVSAQQMEQDRKDLTSIISFIFSRNKDQKSYFNDLGKAVVSVKVIEIIPPKSQSFEESKPLVLKLWRDKSTAGKLSEIGSQVVEQLTNKLNVEETQGIKLIKAQHIYRNSSDYPTAFIEKVFNIKRVESVTHPIQYNGEIIVGILKKMQTSEGKLDALNTGKRIMISLQEQLINYLESEYKVTIDHSVLDGI